MTAAVFAINAGRIAARFGRAVPAMVGALLDGAIGGLLDRCGTAPHPDYLPASCPACSSAASAGLTQAPLFAAAGTLPPDRATTGSAVLNMARQVGSAVGVAVVVVILGAGAAHTLTDYHHVWAAEAIAGLACLAVAVTARRRAGRA